MINLSKVRRGMGCTACDGACGGCNKGVGRLRGLGVMVCCDDEGNLYDDGTSPSSPTDILGGATPDCAFGGVWPNCITPSTPLSPVYTPVTSGSPSVLTLAGQALQAAGTAAAPIVKLASQQAPYYIAGPNGQSVLYNPNTGAVAGAGASVFGSSSASLSPLLLLGGLVAVVMLAGKH